MLTESEMIKQARLTGMDEELVSYAKQIQRQLSAEGDFRNFREWRAGYVF